MTNEMSDNASSLFVRFVTFQFIRKLILSKIDDFSNHARLAVARDSPQNDLMSRGLSGGHPLPRMVLIVAVINFSSGSFTLSSNTKHRPFVEVGRCDLRESQISVWIGLAGTAAEAVTRGLGGPGLVVFFRLLQL
jgi:hypothetical protein